MYIYIYIYLYIYIYILQSKVDSECELNSGPDNSVGYSIWTEFSSHGFKYHSGQLFIAT